MTGALRWIATMAWRDSRPSRRQLLLYSVPLVFGVAALVAVQSLRDNVREAIEGNSRELLGADLFLSSNQPWDEAKLALRKRIPGVGISEINFQTMAYFPRPDGARLVSIRAVERGFPYYGEIRTTPPDRWAKGLAEGEVAMERALMAQFNLEVGDVCKLGLRQFTIAMRIDNTPPRAGYSSLFAPQVMLNQADVASTGLLTPNSLATYRVYFRLPSTTNPDELVKSLEPEIKELRLNSSTPSSTRNSMGRSLDRLYRFLSLIGLASVILGGIGISSAIHQHISRRLPSVAMLRCLGCPMSHAFGVYLLQVIVLGLLGFIGGCLLGLATQASVPWALAKVLPFPISFRVSWPALFSSMGLSTAICLGFGLLPILKIRRIPPLAAIRSSLLGTETGKFDPLVLAMFLGIAVVLLGFCYVQHTERAFGLYYGAGLLAVFALLAAFSKGLILFCRRFAPRSLPFSVRQGIAHLHRPRNQTTAFMLSIGLGVFLIVLLLLAQSVLLQQLDRDRLQERGNLILVDVQPDQRAGVAKLMADSKLEILQESPVVTMRLSTVKGRKVGDLLKDKDSKMPDWLLRREFRSTYRGTKLDKEKILKGEWVAHAPNGFQPGDTTPVSIERGMAEDLKLGLGDELSVDVQGIEMKAKVANIREVDWNSMGLNFYMVFPEGVLEDALGFYLLTSHVSDADTVGRFQTQLIKAFPNISVIDLSSLLELLQSIAAKIAVAIRFMASFTVLTGLLILIATLVSSRSARLREVALLRTLGASNQQVKWVLSSEYLLLGTFAALSGAALAVAAIIPLARQVFETQDGSHLPWLTVAGVIFGAASLTWALGMALSRGLSNSPPLEVLRGQDAT